MKHVDLTYSTKSVAVVKFLLPVFCLVSALTAAGVSGFQRSFNVASGSWESTGSWATSVVPVDGFDSASFGFSGGSSVTLSADHTLFSSSGSDILILTPTVMTGLTTQRTLTLNHAAVPIAAALTLDNVRMVKQTSGAFSLGADVVLQNGGGMQSKTGTSFGFALSSALNFSISSGGGSGNSVTIDSGSTANISGGTGTFSIASGVGFSAAGTFNFTGGTFDTASTTGSLSGTGTFGASGSATFRNSGTLSVGAFAVSATAGNSGTDSFANSGSLTMGSGGVVTFNVPSGAGGGYSLSNSGTFIINAGNAVTINQPFNQSAGTLKLDSPSLTLGSTLTVDGGTVIGSASVAGTGGVTLNSGSALSPGVSGAVGSRGSFSFPAALTLASGASLSIDINSDANFDQVTSAGVATITGASLTVSRNGSVTAGTVFNILSGSGITGTFSGLSEGSYLNASDPSMKFQINYGTVQSNAVTLTAVAVPEPTLYAGAIGVGLVGFTVWRRSQKKS